MFTLAHEHADGEGCFHASNGKYKSRLADNAGQSSPTKKDRKIRGELVANAEKQEGNKPKQSRGGRGKFDEIMNQTCQNHGFPVNHLARDCQTYKREVIQASKEKSKGGRPKKGKDGVDNDDQDGYPNIVGVMIIFGGPTGLRGPPS
jgi:hypothetical protein